MPKGPVNQSHHAVGEIVLVEELAAVDLALEEAVQVQHGRAAIGNEDRVTRRAMGFECHGAKGVGWTGVGGRPGGALLR